MMKSHTLVCYIGYWERKKEITFTDYYIIGLYGVNHET